MAQMDLSLIVSIVSLLLAIWAVRLALATSSELKHVLESSRRALESSHRVEGSAERLDRSVAAMHDDLGENDTVFGFKLDEISEILSQLQGILDTAEKESDEIEGDPGDTDAKPLSDTDPAQYERMMMITIDQLPPDIRNALRAEGTNIRWALQRRGRGRPRWLVGSDDGQMWRVTRGQDGPVSRLLPRTEYQVDPVPLRQKHPEALRALSEATQIPEGDLDEIAFRRRSRGVPVIQAFAPTGPSGESQAWRIVHNRWGWNAVREDE